MGRRLKIRSLEVRRKRGKFPIPIMRIDDSSEFAEHSDSTWEDSDDFSFDPDDCSDVFSEDTDDNSYEASEDDNISDEEENLEDLNIANLDTEIMEDEALLNFPLDIFLDIISRLPVRILAQCRSVCKTWYKAIHHPRFISMHHTRASQFCNGSSTILVPIKCYKSQGVSKIYTLQDNSSDNVMVVKQRFGTQPNFQFELVGSSHGLLCLYEQIYCELFVSNPVTGEYLMLSKPSRSKSCDMFYGFGYDQVSDEYKVIRLVFQTSDYTLNLEVEIYYLRSGTWRNMGEVCYPVRRSSSPILINGAFHWMADEYVGVSFSEYIISFDLNKEQFSTVPSPPGFSFNSDIYKYNLGGLKNHLCFFYWSSSNLFEIWVMNKYGVKDSWTKDYILSEEELGRDSLYLHPIDILESDELLLEYNNELLVCYNKKQNSIRELGTQKLPPAFDATIHAESLISLRDLVGATTSSSRVSGSRKKWYRTIRPIPTKNSS